MNASTRLAIQKRKRLTQASNQAPSSIDLEEVRAAARLKLAQVLKDAKGEGGDKKAEAVAEKLESSLNAKYKAHTPEYKSSFRRLYVSLKGNKSEFCLNLLAGALDPEEFALRSADELKSAKQQHADSTLRKEGMRQSVGKQLLPETVNQMKDGRDREKWGVSRSAAAIDD